MNRRVVITGIGIINSCGEGRNEVWANAAEARSGLSRLEPQECESLDVPVAGFVRNFSGRNYIANRKSLKVMCRDIQMAVAASCLAKKDAGLESINPDPDRSGVCIGAGLFDHELTELVDCFNASAGDHGTFNDRRFGESGMSQLFPLWLLKYLPNMPACHISIAHGLRGPSNTVTNDGAGSAAAFEEAYRIIQRGSADVMFTGGAEAKLNPQGILRYHLSGYLRKNGSSQNPYPLFSEEASGLVLGEGGCVFILEELDHAVKRRARIYAEVLSAFSCVNTDPSGPDALKNHSRLRAMEGAMVYAKAKPEDVGCVHLYANGVVREDRAEAQALQAVFKNCSQKPVLVADKNLTGYLGFASAATEIALAALSIQERRLVPSGAKKCPFLTDAFSFSKGGEIKSNAPVLVNHFSTAITNHAIMLKGWDPS